MLPLNHERVLFTYLDVVDGIVDIGRRTAFTRIFGSSVASFLVWGWRAIPPNVPTKINNVHVTYTRERAPQKHIYFQVSKYICIQIQSMQPFFFLLLRYGAILTICCRYTSDILCLGNIYFQVSNYICIHIQSMQFPFIT